MDLFFDTNLTAKYKSKSQIARVLTEGWVGENIFCPNCGNTLSNYSNNQPVADFYCSSCGEDYELKSKKNMMGNKIVDGAFETMVQRLKSSTNPNFFFLNYDHEHWKVKNFIVIPKYFFTPEIIERRKPLSESAKRAGWIGCNILMNHIPESGKIFFIKDGYSESRDKILTERNKTLFLRDAKGEQKGWLLDTMNIVETLKKETFSLQDMYLFEKYLQSKYPKNNNIQAKIRQQLQKLRDTGYLKFTSRGNYELNRG